MTDLTNRLSEVLRTDLERNREGKLSSRQWLELVTEPLTSLLLLLVPLILIIGRFGVAGRWIVLTVIAGFGIVIAFRAIRFARVKLYYRHLYLETSVSRWMFWRKLQFVTKTGDIIRFDHHLLRRLNIPHEQTLIVYYLEVADRRILVSLIPQKHVQSHLAEPEPLFTRRGGKIITS